MNKQIRPFLKWAGGKTQLLSEIQTILPVDIEYYCEPFIGGGAVFFDILPPNAIIADSNSDLINVYNVIKNDIDELIIDLKKHENTEEYFYNIRELDRIRMTYYRMTPIQMASRIIYLNKTCYNGLYRVNNDGQFNSPYGRYKKPNIVNEELLRNVSIYLNENNIEFKCSSFEYMLNDISNKYFIYLDPPYDIYSPTSHFTKYTSIGFNRDNHKLVKKCCDELTKNGNKFLLSNAGTEFIKDLYKDYNIYKVKARRNINSNPEKRGYVDELLITNY